jgi:hypothetical protein
MTYEQLVRGVRWTLARWGSRQKKHVSQRKCKRYSDFSYSALRARGDGYWLHLEHMTEPNLGEELVICFLNTKEWNSRVCKPEEEKGKMVLRHLKQAVDRLPPYYAVLGGYELGDVDFGRQVRVCDTEMPVIEVVARIYAEFRSIEPRFGPTAASKLMHMANPRLFMMSDRDIRKGYGLPKDVFDDRSYLAFLVFMQESARHVRETQRGDHLSDRLGDLSQRIGRECGCGDVPVTRLLDIANYPVGRHVNGAPDTICQTCKLRANSRLDELEASPVTAQLMARLRVRRFA